MMKNPTVVLPAFLLAIVFATTTAVANGYEGQRPGGGEPHQAEAVFERPQRLGELLHSDVVGRSGETLGTVEDLVANEKGNLEYLILSKRSYLDLGVELVAIPLELVSARIVHDNRLIIDIDEAALEQAPTFSAGDYPDFTNPRWRQESRGYFENRPDNAQDDNQVAPGAWEEVPERPQRATPGMRRQEGPPPGIRDFGTGSAVPGEHTRDEGVTPDTRRERTPPYGTWNGER
jgi:sporulation protein YlmC with PRC-barrel domain